MPRCKHDEILAVEPCGHCQAEQLDRLQRRVVELEELTISLANKVARDDEPTGEFVRVEAAH